LGAANPGGWPINPGTREDKNNNTGGSITSGGARETPTLMVPKGEGKDMKPRNGWKDLWGLTGGRYRREIKKGLGKYKVEEWVTTGLGHTGWGQE